MSIYLKRRKYNYTTLPPFNSTLYELSKNLLPQDKHMEYTVQKGDTIAAVTRMFGTDWKTIKQMNPSAVGKSNRNGNWFLREGKTISVKDTFDSILAEKTDRIGVPEPIEIHSKAKKTAALTETVHTVKAGDTVWEIAVKRYHVNPDDILKLNNISDPTKLQPGQKLRIPLPDKSDPEEVVASWYGEFHHGLPMANGEPYNMYGDTIAHKDIPLGTRVELENPKTGARVRAVVTDRGPYVDGRDVDLSYRLAEKLSLTQQGVGSLIMRVL